MLAPAVPVIVMALILVQYTTAWTTDRATGDAADSAALVAEIAINPLLQESDFTSASVDDQRVAELDDTLQPILGDKIVRVKVWDASGRVVYSDDTNSVGQTFDVSHELAASLRGETASEISELDKDENGAEQQFDRLLEVYVPITLGDAGTVHGAFELYLPYDPIAESIEADTRRVFAMLGVTLALLYLALAYVALLWARAHRRAVATAHDATHDPLTGLANRRKFRSALDELALRRDDQPAALLFIDLDDFKNVNDQHGHAVGDALLAAVADRLQTVLRPDCVFARLGGDEFAVLLTELDDVANAPDVAERLIAALAQPIEIDGLTVRVQASIGIDVTTSDRVDPDLMQRKADAAMYTAKGAGKAQYATSDSGPDACLDPTRDVDQAAPTADAALLSST